MGKTTFKGNLETGIGKKDTIHFAFVALHRWHLRDALTSKLIRLIMIMKHNFLWSSYQSCVTSRMRGGTINKVLVELSILITDKLDKTLKVVRFDSCPFSRVVDQSRTLHSRRHSLGQCENRAQHSLKESSRKNSAALKTGVRQCLRADTFG